MASSLSEEFLNQIEERYRWFRQNYPHLPKERAYADAVNWAKGERRFIEKQLKEEDELQIRRRLDSLDVDN